MTPDHAHEALRPSGPRPDDQAPRPLRAARALPDDQALRDLFRAQQPHFDDDAAFMATLTRRLDAVEYVRRHQEATIRRYRIAMVVAFAVGVVSGAATLAFVLSMPAEVPLFSLQVQSGLLLWFAHNARLISSTLLALLMSLGAISIIANIRDILCMSRAISPATHKEPT